VFYQLNNITTDRNSLPHDDRIEGLAGAVRHFKGVLLEDEHKAAEKRQIADLKKFLDDPMGYGNSGKQKVAGTRSVVHGRRVRK